VVYENDGEPILAVIAAWKKSRYSILNDRGRTAEMDGTRLHALPGKITEKISIQTEIAAYLNDLLKQAKEQAATVPVAELWETLRDGGKEVDTSEITKVTFSDDSVVHHLAIRLALLTDKIYFKRRNEFFIPRPAEVVTELLRAEEASREKQHIIERTYQFITARLKDPETPVPEEAWPTLHLLEDSAANAESLDPAHIKLAKEVIERAGALVGIHEEMRHERKAYQILLRIGHLSPNSNLVLLRYRPFFTFSAAANAQAESIKVPCSALEDNTGRLDLTGIETITIDDVTTLDADDGVSIEQHQGGYRIGIHISDVVSSILPGTPLDFETLKRATSIYLPQGALHMFPKLLAEDRLSLALGTVRPCVSALLEVTHDFKIKETRIARTLVKIAHKISYDEADKILHGTSSHLYGPLLEVLYNFAVEKETARHQSGGMRINKQEVQVVLKENGDFDLVEIEEGSPARALVAELAVLANGSFAQFGVDNKFPLVFRGQSPSEDDGRDFLAIPEGPARDYAVRSRLKHSTCETIAHYHATLGLNAYAQVTSPIRRYLDIVNQRQIVQFLQHGESLYTNREIDTLIQDVEQPLTTAVAITRETKRYWMLRYIERQYKNRETLSGIVTRIDLKLPMVELDKIYTPFPVRMQSKPQLGMHIPIRVAAIDPLWDYVRLEENIGGPAS